MFEGHETGIISLRQDKYKEGCFLEIRPTKILIAPILSHLEKPSEEYEADYAKYMQLGSGGCACCNMVHLLPSEKPPEQQQELCPEALHQEELQDALVHQHNPEEPQPSTSTAAAAANTGEEKPQRTPEQAMSDFLEQMTFRDDPEMTDWDVVQEGLEGMKKLDAEMIFRVMQFTFVSPKDYSAVHRAHLMVSRCCDPAQRVPRGSNFILLAPRLCLTIALFSRFRLSTTFSRESLTQNTSTHKSCHHSSVIKWHFCLFAS